MEYVPFGNTGRIVSRLGYGGAAIGLKNYLGDYDPTRAGDRETAINAIHSALELGVTYFDTAAGYGNGQSETIYGEALANAPRDKLFIATKLGFKGDASKVRQSIEESISRMKLDYVDLIQLHGTSWNEEQAAGILKSGGALDQMLKAKQDGLVRHVGFTSEDNNKAVYDFIADGRFEMYMICYNLFFQHCYDPNRPFGSMFEAEKQKMGIVTMRAPTSGMFTRWMKKVDPDNKRDYTRDLIQFVFSNPLVDVVLVGMRNEQEVRMNAALCDDKGTRLDIMKDLFTYYL
ncbi:MAG: aldo/keto reductase [Treponema sp.]|jgi:aryl-alcohol dehydrogenase-like predicted oxidoreductase|nr:aldo/keto reductase [Treponema sp.]